MNFRCRKVSKIFSFRHARFRSVETRRPRCNHIRSIYDCGRGEGVWSKRARRGLPLWRPFIAAHLCRRDGETQARSLTLVNSLRLRPAAPKSCTTLKSRLPSGWKRELKLAHRTTLWRLSGGKSLRLKDLRASALSTVLRMAAAEARRAVVVSNPTRRR